MFELITIVAFGYIMRRIKMISGRLDAEIVSKTEGSTNGGIAN
jgi:hypothetical protein